MEYKVTEESIEFIRRMVSEGHISQNVAERYFPELKKPVESEDEKMADLIIAICEVNHPNGYFKASPNYVRVEEIVDWLKSLKKRMKGE